MQNYPEYMESAGITQKHIVQILRQYFPLFSKQICSYAVRPQKYGISFCEEAEVLLTKVYGPGPGLAHINYKGEPKKREPSHRKKDQRITVWMTNDMYFRLLSLKTNGTYPTFQSLAEAALEQFIERETNEIPST